MVRATFRQDDFCSLWTAILYFYRPVRLQLGRSMREQPDIHARLMSRYEQGIILPFLSAYAAD